MGHLDQDVRDEGALASLPGRGNSALKTECSLPEAAHSCGGDTSETSHQHTHIHLYLNRGLQSHQLLLRLHGSVCVTGCHREEALPLSPKPKFGDSVNSCATFQI